MLKTDLSIAFASAALFVWAAVNATTGCGHADGQCVLVPWHVTEVSQ